MSTRPYATRGPATAFACLLGLLLAAPGRASAADAPFRGPLAARGTEEGQPPPWSTRWGLMLDVGVPDGAGVSALVRPMRWLRLRAGFTANTFSQGVRGGASVSPLELIVSPVLDVDVGYSFNADYNALLSRLGGQGTATHPSLKALSYATASASLGLEWSPSESVTLYGLGGLSYWAFRVGDVKAFIREAEQDPTISSTPLSLSVTVPTVKLVLLVYFN